MWRSFAVSMAALAVAGCVVSAPVAVLALGPDRSEVITPPLPAKIQLAGNTEPEQKEGGSFLGNIWDNFSSKFRSGEPEKPDQPQTPAVKAGRKSVAKPALDPSAALKLVNAYRATKKLKPLALDTRAAKAASVIAEDMAKHDHMSHTGPNGEDVAARLTAAGYSYKLAAENVGVGQANLDEIIDGWKKSPPHSKNMLLPKAKHMGLAVEYSPATKYQTFWALVIAAPE